MSRIVRNFANFLKEDVQSMSSEEMMKVDQQNVAELEDKPEVQMGEEEGGEYIGETMMKDLASKLGIEYDGTGSLFYNEQEVNFFSETEKFHIANKKFSTAEEVVKFLTK